MGGGYLQVFYVNDFNYGNMKYFLFKLVII